MKVAKCSIKTNIAELFQAKRDVRWKNVNIYLQNSRSKFKFFAQNCIYSYLSYARTRENGTNNSRRQKPTIPGTSWTVHVRHMTRFFFIIFVSKSFINMNRQYTVILVWKMFSKIVKTFQLKTLFFTQRAKLFFYLNE